MLRYSSPPKYHVPTPFAAEVDRAAAREGLIVDHLPKVRYIADRIAAKLPPTVERDDLYGAGVMGLIDAVERYDESRGVAFTTFAEMRVRGAILDNLRSLDWASRSIRKRARDIQNAYGQLEQEHGRPATEEEVADEMKISVAELRGSLQEVRGLRITNLDECDQETGLSLSEMIADRSMTQLDAIERKQQRQILAAAIDKLPERERQVIALYYVKELTMKEVAEVLGVTESRVSQLKSQAAARLRAALSN